MLKYKIVLNYIQRYNFSLRIKGQFPKTTFQPKPKQVETIQTTTPPVLSREEEETRNKEKESFKKFLDFLLERSKYDWNDYLKMVIYTNEKDTSVWKKLRGKTEEEKQEVINTSIY